ncbi:MAG: GH3 auxin-responsive promoter family protein, partial [Oscillospiraceae bacterium]|nr:GH3 auxin-responsive promoter family protein [Oscillospiraceae bacterium]
LLAGFDMLTKNPMAVQTKLLMELLQENKDTEYGKKYGFGEIKSIE